MAKTSPHFPERVEFTKEMKKDYTILIPQMAPLHWKIMSPIFTANGFNVDILDFEGDEVVQTGLKYVHNDTCYPALLTTGQMIYALNSGKYDPHKVAMVIMQSGGGCRASNYIHLQRKALAKAGYGYVPIISANMSRMEKNSGFDVSISMILQLIAGMVYGDLVMLLSNQVRPYEINKGDTDKVIAKWTKILGNEFYENKKQSFKKIAKNLNDVAKDFAAVPIKVEKKIKVGVIGEIYVKYSPFGNNHLEDFLSKQDCEVMIPSLLGFILFKADVRIEDIKLYGGSIIKKYGVNALIKYLLKMEDMLIKAISAHPQFTAPEYFMKTKELTKGVIGYGNRMGEGWFLTAEMLELVKKGYENIVCAQPFGCLPCHVCGKGMINKVRRIDPRANIVAVEYDPGATKVNQENRIKLMLAVAKENIIGSKA